GCLGRGSAGEVARLGPQVAFPTLEGRCPSLESMNPLLGHADVAAPRLEGGCRGAQALLRPVVVSLRIVEGAAELRQGGPALGQALLVLPPPRVEPRELSQQALVPEAGGRET